MSQPINLVLLYGGKSGEHEVSLVSAASVLSHLDPQKYHIIPIGMDKQGHFFVNNYETLLEYKKSLPVKTSDSRPLGSLVVNGRLAVDADVVFPVVHGPLYEDGALQGLLELADVAYVGCRVLASALCMDKEMARRMIPAGLVDCARYYSVSAQTKAEEKQALLMDAIQSLGWPLFVKPCALGSSVGIRKVQNLQELQAAVQDALRYDETVLIEEFIDGREIELAVLESLDGSRKPLVSTAGEIVVNHADGFYSYTAKYIESNQTDLIVPATISDRLLQDLQYIAAKLFTAFKCEALARVDFFVNRKTEKIYFNEINSLPGFTPISMYPRLWEASNLAYPHLLDHLIQLACLRHRQRGQLVKSYQ